MAWFRLRERLTEKAERPLASELNPETDITITLEEPTLFSHGAVLQPGDEVIVFEPAYDSYIPTIEIKAPYLFSPTHLSWLFN
jgi:methionine aminotransferase